jgi:hypothetical protein
MQPPGFWCDLEKDFRRLSDPPDRRLAACEHEHGTWSLGGGPREKQFQASLKTLFRATAVRAAIGADLVREGADPLHAWLNRLRQGAWYVAVEVGSDSPSEGLRVLEGGWIDRVCVASAECCIELQAEAFQRRATAEANERQTPPQPAQSQRTYKTSLAENLDWWRQQCGWSFEMLARKTGISKDAVLDNITKGTVPHAANLKAYADAFTKAGHAVSVAELKAPTSHT